MMLWIVAVELAICYICIIISEQFTLNKLFDRRTSLEFKKIYIDHRTQYSYFHWNYNHFQCTVPTTVDLVSRREPVSYVFFSGSSIDKIYTQQTKLFLVA